MERLDKGSAMAEELKKFDVEMILKHDIQTICSQASFFEMMGVMGLIIKLKSGGTKQEVVKAELKETAKNLIHRIERDSGKLQTPESCRELLFNL
ncbi:MAG: hypothetical protein HQL15_01495 [Candidatus Omnitrophica bacterium]|nr:hypothetical protein [Candidatus Omnitrophota bacterium]